MIFLVVIPLWGLSLVGACCLTAWWVRRSLDQTPIPPREDLVGAKEPGETVEPPIPPPGDHPAEIDPLVTLVQGLEFHSQCQANLAQGVIDHLSSTTAPLGENLLAIQAALDTLVGQIRQEDHELRAKRDRAWLRTQGELVHKDMSQAASLTAAMNQSAGAHFLRLKKTLEGILQINGQIADISERTHILSINASIEAARAGAAGRGFQVIANQVKAMATETAALLSKVESALDATESLFGHIEVDLERRGREVFSLLEAQKKGFTSFEDHYLDQQVRHDRLHEAIVQFAQFLDQRINRFSPVVQSHEISTQELENLLRIRWSDFEGLPSLPQGGDRSSVPVESWAQTVRTHLTTAEELKILESTLVEWGLEPTPGEPRPGGEVELF